MSFLLGSSEGRGEYWTTESDITSLLAWSRSACCPSLRETFCAASVTARFTSQKRSKASNIRFRGYMEHDPKVIRKPTRIPPLFRNYPSKASKLPCQCVPYRSPRRRIR